MTPISGNIFGWDMRFHVMTSRQKFCKRSGPIVRGTGRDTYFFYFLDIVKLPIPYNFDRDGQVLLIRARPNVREAAG
jgi:hypothetical protein